MLAARAGIAAVYECGGRVAFSPRGGNNSVKNVSYRQPLVNE
jgi:hypothetical protein